jgi:hypothetical protein
MNRNRKAGIAFVIAKKDTEPAVYNTILSHRECVVFFIYSAAPLFALAQGPFHVPAIGVCTHAFFGITLVFLQDTILLSFRDFLVRVHKRLFFICL